MPKVSKMSISFELLKVSKMNNLKSLYLQSLEARNIKFGQHVNIIERVPLGTPPLAVVMSSAHNHMTNLFISSYRGATVSNLDSKSNSVIEVDRALLHWM